MFFRFSTNKNKSDKDDMKEEVRLPKEEKSRTKDRKEEKHTREDRSYRVGVTPTSAVRINYLESG